MNLWSLQLLLHLITEVICGNYLNLQSVYHNVKSEERKWSVNIRLIYLYVSMYSHN